MSYRTIFNGKIKIEPILPALTVYGLKGFSIKRHDAKKWPGYYCPWLSDDTGEHIVMVDSDSSIYDAETWLKRIIDEFLQGHVLNGIITCTGEEAGDYWRIRVEDSKVYRDEGSVVYENGNLVV